MNLLNLGIVNFPIQSNGLLKAFHLHIRIVSFANYSRWQHRSWGVRLGDGEECRVWHSEGHPVVGTRML